MLNSVVFRIGYSLLHYGLDKYPVLTDSLYSLIKPERKKLSVNQNTQIVIEGFPRSANTFAVVAFKYQQTNQVKIAHHLHIPAQVIKAAQLRIPTIILIRHPEDAIISLIIRESRISIKLALKVYISFYKAIEKFDDYYIIASFEEVTQNYGNVISRLNEKFGTKFVAHTPQGDDLSKIKERIKSITTLRNENNMQISLPSEEKKPLQEILRKEIEQSKYKKLLTTASTIYDEFLLFRQREEKSVDLK